MGTERGLYERGCRAVISKRKVRVEERIKVSPKGRDSQSGFPRLPLLLHPCGITSTLLARASFQPHLGLTSHLLSIISGTKASHLISFCLAYCEGVREGVGKERWQNSNQSDVLFYLQCARPSS